MAKATLAVCSLLLSLLASTPTSADIILAGRYDAPAPSDSYLVVDHIVVDETRSVDGLGLGGSVVWAEEVPGGADWILVSFQDDAFDRSPGFVCVDENLDQRCGGGEPIASGCGTVSLALPYDGWDALVIGVHASWVDEDVASCHASTGTWTAYFSCCTAANQRTIDFKVDVPAANDLHIWFKNGVDVHDEGSFQDYSGSGTNRIDLENPDEDDGDAGDTDDYLEQGDEATLVFRSDAPIQVKCWWWTLDGERVGTIHGKC